MVVYQEGLLRPLVCEYLPGLVCTCVSVHIHAKIFHLMWTMYKKYTSVWHADAHPSNFKKNFLRLTTPQVERKL